MSESGRPYLDSSGISPGAVRDKLLQMQDTDKWSVEAMENRFPPWVRGAIKKFLLDKSTGNVTLNIKDGRILGIRTETLINPPKT